MAPLNDIVAPLNGLSSVKRRKLAALGNVGLIFCRFLVSSVKTGLHNVENVYQLNLGNDLVRKPIRCGFKDMAVDFPRFKKKNRVVLKKLILFLCPKKLDVDSQR